VHDCITYQGGKEPLIQPGKEPHSKGLTPHVGDRASEWYTAAPCRRARGAILSWKQSQHRASLKQTMHHVYINALHTCTMYITCTHVHEHGISHSKTLIIKAAELLFKRVVHSIYMYTDSFQA